LRRPSAPWCSAQLACSAVAAARSPSLGFLHRVATFLLAGARSSLSSSAATSPWSFLAVPARSHGRRSLARPLGAQPLSRVYPLLFLFAGRSSQQSVPSLRRAPSRRSSLPSSFSALSLAQHRLLLLVDATLPSFDAAP
jgi:hypothetical protein